MIKKHNCLLLLIFILSFFSLLNNSYSQLKGLSPLDAESIFKDDALSNMDINKNLKNEKIIVGNVINSEFYYVGPGDILAIQNMSASVNQQYITISPENTILLPRFGEIPLSGKTLKQVRDTILKLIGQRNPNSLASVTLYQPRTVMLTINGNVLNPGTLVMPATYNIMSALKISNYEQTSNRNSLQESIALTTYNDKKQQREKLLSESGLPEKTKYGIRNIFIKHADGSHVIADLMKATAFSDCTLNPYIREGDEIYMPYEPDYYPTISIGGAVNHPGVIPFKQGDKASFLLKLSGGFRDYADQSNVYLYLSDSTNRIPLILDSNMQIQGNDYELLPGSMILVGQKPIPTSPNNGLVAISGCVKSPGVFPIVLNKSRLKDLIDIAGGLTMNAYLPLAKIFRRDKESSFTTNTRKEIDERFQYSDLTLDDTIRFNMDMNMRQPLVSCDFVAAFVNNSEQDNIFLQDGDMIIIPSNPGSIFVYGQVNKPGYITYENNKDMEYYINRAGGYAVGAKSSRARIIRGKSKIWVEDEDDVKVYAGDEIYVPRPPDLPPGTNLQTWSLLAGALGAAAALLNVIIFGFIRK